jgi:hypothetical protein
MSPPLLLSHQKRGEWEDEREFSIMIIRLRAPREGMEASYPIHLWRGERFYESIKVYCMPKAFL